MFVVMTHWYTVPVPVPVPINYVSILEPPIKDPLSSRHNRNNLSTKDMFQGPKCSFPHIVNTFLTSEERTTSLQRTKWLAPMCPLFTSSTVDV